MDKKKNDNEPMLEESSDEILLEETTSEETLLEESFDSEALLEEDPSESVPLEEESEVLLEEATGQAAAISGVVGSVKKKAEEKAADEKRYKAAREHSIEEAEADRRRMAEKGVTEQNAEEANFFTFSQFWISIFLGSSHCSCFGRMDMESLRRRFTWIRLLSVHVLITSHYNQFCSSHR